MRYLTISEYGTFLGVSGSCLIIKHEGKVIKEIALSRLRTISITKSGVSLSSDLLEACALRGIKVLFLDWKGGVYSALMGQNQHAVVAIRKSQFLCNSDPIKACEISKRIILSKVRNQRAVLLYFGKYIAKKSGSPSDNIRFISEKLILIIQQIKALKAEQYEWSSVLLGYEGKAAALYWQCLSETHLLPNDFSCREGRNALSITNKALNYGYAILVGYVWAALDNAGLEVYSGFFHVDRPGKPSLVLDLMEEYRAWVVDRTVIKLRERLLKAKAFDADLKKQISNGIHQTMQAKYSYNKKQVKLENILQRQVYRLTGYISGDANYKGYSFKW